MFEFKNICYKAILKNIDLSLKNECLHFLIGPNGSGKSTLLKYLSNAFEFKNPFRISYLSPSMDYDQKLSVIELLEIYSLKKEQLLPIFNLEDFLSKKLYEMSSGELQRLRIAIHMSIDKDLYLFDEPTNYLDWYHADTFLKALQNFKKTYLIACHDFHWMIRANSAKVILIHDGQVCVSEDINQAFVQTQTQKAFNFQAKITDNPLDGSKLLALTAYEKQ